MPRLVALGHSRWNCRHLKSSSAALCHIMVTWWRLIASILRLTILATFWKSLTNLMLTCSTYLFPTFSRIWFMLLLLKCAKKSSTGATLYEYGARMIVLTPCNFI